MILTKQKLLALSMLLVAAFTNTVAQSDLKTGETYLIRNIATNQYLTFSPDDGLTTSENAVEVTFENNDGWTIIKSTDNTDWQMNYNDMPLSDGQEGYNCWTLSKKGENLYTISCRVKETYAGLYVCSSFDNGIYLLNEQPELQEGLWEITIDPIKALHEVYEVAKTYDVGEGLNKYSLYLTILGTETLSNNTWDNTIVQVEQILEGEETTTDQHISTLASTLEGYINKLRHNMPAEGTFIRIMSKKHDGKYVQNVNVSSTKNHGTILGVSDSKDKKSIFLVKDNSLVSYSKGLYVNTDNNNRLQLATNPGDNTTVTFATAIHNKHNYALKFNTNRFLYAYESEVDAGSSDSESGYEFVLETVGEIPITMNLVDGAYYGTINFPVAVVIPEGMSAYSAKDNGNSLTLTKVAGDEQALSANTPVIIYSNDNIEKLSISADEDVTVTDNDLQGTIEAITVEAGNYVLSATDSEGIGFYKYTNTKMPPFKAYFTATSAQSQRFGFVFDDDDLTGIANAIKEAAKSNTTVFDINGRKVNELLKGQLYIKGGKKFRY